MRNLRSACVLAGAIAVLALAPAATADTCCANTHVTFTPASAEPGDRVEIHGIRCLGPDNHGPLELNLVAFWLSTDRIPADDPGDVPGNPAVHLADDLPRVGRWLPFESVTHAGQTRKGTATIIVPDLPDGSYQLWWRCDNGGGRGSGIHYAGGARLYVGIEPDTATVDPAPAPPSSVPAFVAVVGLIAGLVTFVRLSGARRHSR